VAGYSGRDNKPLGSIKFGFFFVFVFVLWVLAGDQITFQGPRSVELVLGAGRQTGYPQFIAVSVQVCGIIE
jgi:hypothetical protein